MRVSNLINSELFGELSVNILAHAKVDLELRQLGFGYHQELEDAGLET